jgi:hypothetical protein
MSVTLNASTSSGLVQTADTSGTIELQSNGTTRLTVASTGAYGQLVSGTAVASTSGTSIDFTSIPSWVKRITVMLNGVSTNGASNLLIQVGSGSVNTSGYSSAASYATTSVNAITSTIGFVVTSAVFSTSVTNGTVTLCLCNSNTWVSSSVVSLVTSTGVQFSSGVSPSLSGTLDRVRITTVNGTDTFDAGSINILYEG